MTIEAGKTYITREGKRVRIELIYDRDDFAAYWRCVGEDDQGRVTWRSLKGRFTSHPHRLDLVGEAPV